MTGWQYSSSSQHVAPQKTRNKKFNWTCHSNKWGWTLQPIMSKGATQICKRHDVCQVRILVFIERTKPLRNTHTHLHTFTGTKTHTNAHTCRPTVKGRGPSHKAPIRGCKLPAAVTFYECLAGALCTPKGIRGAKGKGGEGERVNRSARLEIWWRGPCWTQQMHENTNSFSPTRRMFLSFNS